MSANAGEPEGAEWGFGGEAIGRPAATRFRRIIGTQRSVGSALLFALIGVSALLAVWEAGAVIVRQTAREPNVVWPSLEYVVGTALPEIGKVGSGFEGATSTVTGSTALHGRGGYGPAFHVLLQQSAITVPRVLIGTAIGALLGIALGFAVSFNQLVRRMVYPVVNFIRQIPLFALSLLFLVWFGGAAKSIYIYIVFGTSTILMLNTINAIRNVPEIQFSFARVLGADRIRLLRTVVAPAVVPELMSGVKVAVGLAWAMALAAEYLGVQQGLGRLMLFFETFAYTGRMVVVVAVFIFWAVLVHLMITLIEARLTRWVPRT